MGTLLARRLPNLSLIRNTGVQLKSKIAFYVHAFESDGLVGIVKIASFVGFRRVPWGYGKLFQTLRHECLMPEAYEVPNQHARYRIKIIQQTSQQLFRVCSLTTIPLACRSKKAKATIGNTPLLNATIALASPSWNWIGDWISPTDYLRLRASFHVLVETVIRTYRVEQKKWR